MRQSTVIAAFAVAFLTVCCVGPSPTPTPSPSPSPRRSPINDQVTQLIAEVAGADSPGGSELDTAWSSIMSELSGSDLQPYQPPVAVVPYYSGEVPPGTCGASEPVEFWRNNAFDCQHDRTIVYDEDWLRDFANRAGNTAPVAILAHEWGHHIQQLLGETGYDLQMELQADCFAGLYLANTQKVLPGVVASEQEMIVFLKTFFELGDDTYQASLWFQTGEHGSAQQRIRSFSSGYLASFNSSPDLPPPVGKGIAVCYGYRDFKTPDYAPIEPYQFLNLPGRTESSVADTYAIAPESWLGVPTSAVMLRWLPGDTTDEILAQLPDVLPGLQPFGDQISLDKNVAPGTGFATAFQQPIASANGGMRVGMLGLITPAAGHGAMLVVVYRDDAPQEEVGAKRMFAEQIPQLYEVIARLCGPDDSDVIGQPNLKVTCLVDQQ